MITNNEGKIIGQIRFIKKARFEFMKKLDIDTAIRNMELFELYDIIEKYLIKKLIKSGYSA